MKRFSLIVLATLAAALLFSTACAPSAEVVLSSTPEATISATDVPTASPTPTVSPVPTPTPIFSEARTAELNQQFQDFLNKEGEFTQEKIASMMMITQSVLANDKVGLGIADQQPLLQGYFFDYLEKDDRLFLLLGFDGKDGNRFITPLEITLYLYEAVEPAVFQVTRAEDNYVGSCFDEGAIDYGKRAKLMPLLDTLKGNTFCILLRMKTFTEDQALANEFGQVIIDNLNEINSKQKLSFGLLQLVQANGIDYNNPEKIEGDTSSILKIYSVDDFSSIDVSDVPLVLAMHYFKEDNK